MRFPRAAAPLASALILASVAVLAAAPAAHAATIEVTTTDDEVDGNGCPGPDCSLREAALAAVDGDVISLAPGATYELTLGELDIAAIGSVVIEGNGAAIEQTGTNARVLRRETGDLTVRDITITGGDIVSVLPPDEADGGGILLEGGGTLTVERSLVNGNHAADDGGGLHAGRIRLIDSQVIQNTAGDDGGGVAAELADHLEIAGSVISGNTATGSGGGVFASGTGELAATVVGSSIAQNQGEGVGGMLLAPGDATVVNSSVLDNTGTGRSSIGGLNVDGALTLRYATLAGNTGEGGANLWAQEVVSFASVLGEPIDGPNCSDEPIAVTSLGRNAADDDSCGLDHATDQESLATVGLAPMPMNVDLHRPPAPGSPLLDAVPLASCAGPGGDVDDDQLGTARPQGAGCDIGAVEVVVLQQPTTTTTTAPPPSAPPAQPTTAEPTFTG